MLIKNCGIIEFFEKWFGIFEFVLNAVLELAAATPGLSTQINLCFNLNSN